MSDTLYCVVSKAGGAGAPSSTVSYFGKNSDRHPGEPQVVSFLPRRPAAESLQLGEKSWPLKDSGFSFLLSRPIWLRGGEMGVNEKGVAIGREEVVSKYKTPKDGVLGADILRAALSTAGSAKEAVDFICCFVENHDQGGNSALFGSVVTDSSYLISDPKEAYVLETAGRRWAWRAVYGHEALSNAYVIDEDYKRLDTQSRKEIAPVNERAACSDEADPGRKGSKESWKEHVEKKSALRSSKGEIRRALAMAGLGAFSSKAGTGDRPSILGFLDVLRGHGNTDPAHPWTKQKEGLCMHPAGIPPIATTASFAVEYRGEDSAIVWFTGTSYPCISLYKPMLLVKGEFIPLWSGYDLTEGTPKSTDYWKRWYDWQRKSKAGQRGHDAAYEKALGHAQESLAMIARKALADLASAGSAGSAEPARKGDAREGTGVAGAAATAASSASPIAVLRREAEAVIAGWEKDAGF